MGLKFAICSLFLILNIKAALSYPGDVSFVVSSSESPKENEKKVEDQPENHIPVIYEMDITSNVSNRFARTLITSKVKNPLEKANEAVFSVVLPEKAFISEFIMEIGGKSYKAYVKEKEEAKNIYNQAVHSGQSAAHVAVSARDSNRFTVSVNVEAAGKAVFFLTYEELLERKNGQYELVMNIHPGQIVKDLNVQININESRPLVFVKTPSLRSGNEISKNDEKINPSSAIEIINQTSAVVKFHPDAQQQREFAKQLHSKESDGLSGQFVVQYEVERDPHGGEILLHDGYFVHFFAPKDIEPLPKNIYFILDTSSSMMGLKIKQLKDAMLSILGEIKPEDSLSIVEFNSNTLVWNIEAETSTQIQFDDYKNPFPQLSNNDMPGPIPATPEIVRKAKRLVERMQATGGTYMIGGLETGLYLVKSEIERTASSTNKKQPIIIFLTDGQPNIGLYSTSEITDTVTRLNEENLKVPIYSLSFGSGADKAFLRRLSLKNMGFSRHIYDAADASLQLQEFYKLISSPLLSNVNFKYDSDVAEVTRTVHPILFNGSEIVVAGIYRDPGFGGKVHAIGPIGPIIFHPKVETPVTSLERLWAYLTVRELLDKRDAADNKTELTKKALDIALKYSFVTDVSSLVVVKPNATNAVNTEDASKPQYPHSTLIGLPGASSNNRPSLYWAPPFGGSRPAYIGQSHSFAFHTLSSADAIGWENQRGSPSFPPPRFTSTASTAVAPPVLHKLEDRLPWLASILSANGTLTLPAGVFELGDISLNLPADGVCPKTLNGTEGNCTLIKDCPQIFPLLTDFEVYKQYFCPVQNKYAGVCCQKNVS